VAIRRLLILARALYRPAPRGGSQAVLPSGTDISPGTPRKFGRAARSILPGETCAVGVL